EYVPRRSEQNGGRGGSNGSSARKLEILAQKQAQGAFTDWISRWKLAHGLYRMVTSQKLRYRDASRDLPPMLQGYLTIRIPLWDSIKSRYDAHEDPYLVHQHKRVLKGERVLVPQKSGALNASGEATQDSSFHFGTGGGAGAKTANGAHVAHNRSAKRGGATVVDRNTHAQVDIEYNSHRYYFVLHDDMGLVWYKNLQAYEKGIPMGNINLRVRKSGPYYQQGPQFGATGFGGEDNNNVDGDSSDSQDRVTTHEFAGVSNSQSQDRFPSRRSGAQQSSQGQGGVDTTTLADLIEDENDTAADHAGAAAELANSSQ
ncbi:unnamed protein product, partial [Amoebophrya sp. A25]